MHNFFKYGKLKSGIQLQKVLVREITKNLENVIIDECFQVSDEEALSIVFKMIEVEGLILGGSSVINIVGAIKLGKKLDQTKK